MTTTKYNIKDTLAAFIVGIFYLVLFLGLTYRYILAIQDTSSIKTNFVYQQF